MNGERTILCARCDFQRGEQVSTPWDVDGIKYNLGKVGIFRGQTLLGAPFRAFPLQPLIKPGTQLTTDGYVEVVHL